MWTRLRERSSGFPNPLIGVAAWIAPIVVGGLLAGGARFDRWFWAVFNLGFVFAGLRDLADRRASSSIGALCPWYMLTWAVVIRAAMDLRDRARERVPGPGRGAALRSRLRLDPFITLLCYSRSR